MLRNNSFVSRMSPCLYTYANNKGADQPVPLCLILFLLLFFSLSTWSIEKKKERKKSTAAVWLSVQAGLYSCASRYVFSGHDSDSEQATQQSRVWARLALHKLAANTNFHGCFGYTEKGIRTVETALLFLVSLGPNYSCSKLRVKSPSKDLNHLIDKPTNDIDYFWTRHDSPRGIFDGLLRASASAHSALYFALYKIPNSFFMRPAKTKNQTDRSPN